MHTIHHTKAVILKSQSAREADKMYWLFTQDFGLVVAIATGVRKSGAKLAGQLGDYSFIEVDLVKGRDVWRLVSATAISSPLLGNTTHPLARAYVRTLQAVGRFVADEGVHTELFALLFDAGEVVSKGVFMHGTRFDTLVIWRILLNLGYIADEEVHAHLATRPLQEALEALDDATTKVLIAQVHTAIKETHL